MPLDGNPAKYEQRIATKDEFWSATPRERLAMLAYALRHMPETHWWDYGSPRTAQNAPRDWCGSAGCAIGLTDALWRYEYNGAEKAFALHEPTGREIKPIFFEANHLYGVPMSQVTPHMVADAIDRYLTTGRVEP